MKEFIGNSVSKLKKTKVFLSSKVSEKHSLIRGMINELPILTSIERTNKNSDVVYDEKHYFVVPYYLSDVKISLHAMRNLPVGVPEINQLPKRRVFHFPNEHAEYQVREILLDQGRNIVKSKVKDNTHTLEQLANDIDKLDTKLTYGLLLVGGVAAFVNPLVGVSIAAKAVLPGTVSIINKFGLRAIGEKFSQSKLKHNLHEAEKKILSEFEHATTVQVINPLLQELDLALMTDEMTHDPLLDFDMSSLNIPELDDLRWRELTESAIYHINKDCLEDVSMHHDANLGPEDIRWLSAILVNQSSN